MSAAIDRLRQWLAVPPQSVGDGVWVDRADLRALLADYDVERVEREREWTKGRAAEADRDALRRELDALRQTHTGDLARERERVEAAERECERRGAELARVRAAVRMHESAREQMDAHDRATLRSLAGDSRAVLIEELAGARRERDDWNARATSLEFERDAAIADAAGLRAVAPRTTPPTEAEAAAHNAALGWWLISREGVAPPAAVDAFRGDGDVTAHLPFVRGATWLPLDRDGRPTAWPVAAPDAATQRAGEGGADG